MKPPTCGERRCLHFQGAIPSQPDDEEDTRGFRCEAFPEGIPSEIVHGDNLHLEPYPGDNGIQYERRRD